MITAWKKWFQWCCVAVWLCALAACRVERPETVFSNDRMETILYDFHLAKAMGEELSYDERYKQTLYREAVFRKHGITEAEFDSSMVWYARHPEVLAGIYEHIREKLRTQKDYIDNLIAERDNKPKASLPGDSVDVWMWEDIYQLSGTPLDNKLTFMLLPDTNFHDRDTLRWNVRFRFLAHGSQDSLDAPVMAMQVHYKNGDSIVTGLCKILADTVGTVMLTADTLGKMSRISGFIYYPVQSVPRPLLLDQISLMRYHATDTLVVDTAGVPSFEQAEEKPVPPVKPTSVSGQKVQQRVVTDKKNARPLRPLRKVDKPLAVPKQSLSTSEKQP